MHEAPFQRRYPVDVGAVGGRLGVADDAAPSERRPDALIGAVGKPVQATHLISFTTAQSMLGSSWRHSVAAMDSGVVTRTVKDFGRKPA